MSEFAAGHVKFNPDTQEVAQRSIFSEDDPRLVAMAWTVISPSAGARHTLTIEVEDWDDLVVPGAND